MEKGGNERLVFYSGFCGLFLEPGQVSGVNSDIEDGVLARCRDLFMPLGYFRVEFRPVILVRQERMDPAKVGR